MRFQFLIFLISAICATGQSVWFSADSLPLLGKCIENTATSLRYQRLPDSLEHTVKRHPLFYNGRHSTGMAIRFASNSPAIYIKWKSVLKNEMNQMTPTGTRGLDLYTMQPDSTWTFVNSARPDIYSATTETCVIANMDPVMREYMLHLPLYDSVDSLYIGTDQGYSITQPHNDLPYAANPVVYYGTSLVHGGCVNRPGMAPSNQLRRRLNRDFINLGFGGNGQLDLEIAEIIAATANPSLVILDHVANCSSGQIDTLMIPFVNIIRTAHPDVPILFIECLNHPRCRFDTALRDSVSRHNVIMRHRYDELKEKYSNLHFLPADGLTGYDNEHTVDALHFSDLGALRFSDSLEPVIRKITP